MEARNHIENGAKPKSQMSRTKFQFVCNEKNHLYRINLNYFYLLLPFSRLDYKKTSEEIIAKVLEVTPTEIKYKKFDYQSGPIFTILKSEVLMIRYEKGPSDIFKESQTFVVEYLQAI